jgi:aspartyl/glutamyl-tRNA(Asn/Gln) amidotransferase C subunit
MIKANDIKDVARIASLYITQEEEKQFHDDLERVFHWVEKLEELCLQALPEMANVACPLVEDCPETCPEPSILLQNAAVKSGQFFTVPRSGEDLR